MAKSESPQWTGKSIRKLSLHRRRVNPMNWGYGLEHLPFFILYAYSLYHCYLTVGEPYAQAMKELEESGLLPPSALTSGTGDEASGLAASTLMQGSVREVPASSTFGDSLDLVREHL